MSRPQRRSTTGRTRRARALGALGAVLTAAALTPADVRAATATPARSAGVPVQVVLTSPNLRQAALSTEPATAFSARPLPRGVGVLNVDDHIQFQPILGIGAAMTDSSAYLIHQDLSPTVQGQVLSALFSPTGGIGLNFVRVPMGGSDFDVNGQPYTYDDQPAGQTDPSLSGFSIAHDLAYIAPTLQSALKLNPTIDLIATEWSAPGWMKQNGTTDDLNRNGNLLAADYPVLAQYFVKFIEAYGTLGLPVWAVTPENEPGTAVGYPSMNLTPQQEASFVNQDLAPAFAQAGLSTRIYGSDTGGAEPSYAEITQQNAAPTLSGEAWHCYGGQAGYSSFHNLFPQVQELMTECSPGIIPYTGGEAVIDALRNWASTATLWNIALDPTGGPIQKPNGCPNCTGLVTVDPASHTASFGRDYYQLGQVSKFVQRGAVRIYTRRWVSDVRSATGPNGVTAGLDNVALLNPDGSRVLIAYNHATRPIRFGVSWNDRQFGYTLAPGAMVTFRWAAPGPHSVKPAQSRCLNAGVQYVQVNGTLTAKPAC